MIAALTVGYHYPVLRRSDFNAIPHDLPSMVNHASPVFLDIYAPIIDPDFILFRQYGFPYPEK